MASASIQTPAAGPKIEKFSTTELTNLRMELLKSGLDSWQSGEVITGFLASHGYGVSAQEAREIIPLIERPTCTAERMQAELEKIAFVQ
jgi:hypothetical protein